MRLYPASKLKYCCWIDVDAKDSAVTTEVVSKTGFLECWVRALDAENRVYHFRHFVDNIIRADANFVSNER